MALVIENGSLVLGANSFVDVAAVRTYANARAANSLPADDITGNAAIEAACIIAVDYLESFRDEYKGTKVDPATQTLQWPRRGALLDGWELPITTIPELLKNAQCQLVIEYLAGVDLTPTGNGKEIIREKVDVIETQYAEGTNTNSQPYFTKDPTLLG